MCGSIRLRKTADLSTENVRTAEDRKKQNFQLFRCSENCTSSSSTDSRSPIRPVFTDSSISMHFATLSLSLCTEKLFARFILRRTTKSRIPVF